MRPSISILIPTLNCASVLKECLRSIGDQDYPKDRLEIIVADGGSTDNTLKVVGDFIKHNPALKIKIVSNILKSGEAGKAVALKEAKGELVALIDSDNILPEKNWFNKMIEPFSDVDVIGSEPWEFSYRKTDGFIDRYCALLGMNDPLCLFLGNYDRKNVLTGRWTGFNIRQEERKGWLKITLQSPAIPTIGANGTIFRKDELLKGCNLQKNLDYLFDIDIISLLASQKQVKFAKVKVGIIHLFGGSSVIIFIRKQRRRAKDFFYYQRNRIRSYPWAKQNRRGLFKFVVSCVTILPLLWQTAKGYCKKPDLAWLFHPVACYLTLFIYSLEMILSIFKDQP